MTICATLFSNVEWSHILVAAVAQHFFQFFYYAKLVAKSWTRLQARDKGVTDFEKVVLRHGMFSCLIVSFIASICRALFIVATLNLLNLRKDSNCQFCAYVDAGLLVSAVFLVGQHHEIWFQRPCGIQLLNIGADTFSTLLASVVLYYFSH